MKFTITKKFILAKVAQKGKVNLYTFLDTDDFSKLTAIGVKIDRELPERSLVNVTLNIRTQNERFELKNGEKKYIESASVFVSDLELDQ